MEEELVLIKKLETLTLQHQEIGSEIDKLKLSLFKRAAEGGAFNIADYGVILVSGYGMEPPPYIRQQYEGEED